MLQFLSKRIVAMLLTMLSASVLVFVVLEVSPGSVATKVLGPAPPRSSAGSGWTSMATAHPWHALFRLAGESRQGRFRLLDPLQDPVHTILWPRLANTGLLGLSTFAVMIPLSLTLGVLAGMRAGSVYDRLISLVSILTTSVPEFASAVALSAIFVFSLAWLPGTSAMADGFTWLELVLPTAVLVLYDLATSRARPGPP